MLTFHDKLIEYFEENNTSTGCKQDDGSTLSIVDSLPILFINYRHSSTGHMGLRLSKFGNGILSAEFTSYTTAFTDNHFGGEIAIAFDRKMAWPYFFTDDEVTFYNANDMAWFKLNGSSLRSFVEVSQ